MKLARSENVYCKSRKKYMDRCESKEGMHLRKKKSAMELVKR